jgi:hypothetical protein
MILTPIHARHVDYAWRDGANALGEATVEECTNDQLKMLIARGERQLLRMDKDGKTVGWAVFRVDMLPNMNVLWLTNLSAHNAHFEQFYVLLEQIAKDLGCSRIRFAASPSHRRLYKMKLKAQDVYQVMEKVIQ